MSVKTASCRHCRTPERIASLHYLMAKSFDENIDRLADQLTGSSEAFDRRLEESRAEHQRQDSLVRLNILTHWCPRPLGVVRAVRRPRVSYSLVIVLVWACPPLRCRCDRGRGHGLDGPALHCIGGRRSRSSGVPSVAHAPDRFVGTFLAFGCGTRLMRRPRLHRCRDRSSGFALRYDPQCEQHAKRATSPPIAHAFPAVRVCDMALVRFLQFGCESA